MSLTKHFLARLLETSWVRGWYQNAWNFEAVRFVRCIGAALRGLLGHATSWLLQATTHRARARTLRLHTRTTPPRTLITHNLALRGALDAY